MSLFNLGILKYAFCTHSGPMARVDGWDPRRSLCSQGLGFMVWDMDEKRKIVFRFKV